MNPTLEQNPIAPRLVPTASAEESHTDVDLAANWYAIHTRSHFEKKVFQQLSAKAITAFLPRVQIQSRRTDRRKMILIPLFPGYLFTHVELTPENHLDVLKTPGVVRLIGIHGHPLPVDQAEIANLRILDGTDQPIKNLRFMKKGDRVMIMDGPLKGLVGIFLRRANEPDRVVVSVEFLRQSVSVVADEWILEKVH